MTVNHGLRIAVSGKGGVGKTTLASILCHLYAREGKKVLAVDADPDANLGMALGFKANELEAVTSIASDKELIKERTGAEPGKAGQWFTLNPRVDDIPRKYVIEKSGIQLLQIGCADAGGAGCYCTENNFIKSLLNHLIVSSDETVIVDLEAGLEHMGRGTARGVDAFIVVVEPGQRSFHTARATVKLARDLGVKKVFAVANKVNPGQEEAIRQAMDFLPVLGFLPYDKDIVNNDLAGETIFGRNKTMVSIVEQIKTELEKALL